MITTEQLQELNTISNLIFALYDLKMLDEVSLSSRFLSVSVLCFDRDPFIFYLKSETFEKMKDMLNKSRLPKYFWETVSKDEEY